MKPSLVCSALFCASFFSALCQSDETKLTDQNRTWTIQGENTETSENVITFAGKVVANAKDLSITCDKLVWHLNEDGAVLKFVATGKVVTVKRLGANKQIQVAKSRKAEYSVDNSDIILTGGPPYLRDGDQYINSNNEAAKIFLYPKGKYRVTSPVQRPGPIVIPIKSSKEAAKTNGKKELER